jgi:hypothetical protein
LADAVGILEGKGLIIGWTENREFDRNKGGNF